jgi:uncharacterized protein YqfA (UPF0365 family)
MLLAQNTAFVIIALAIAVFIIVIAAIMLQVFGLWFQALMTGVPLSVSQIVMMRFRKVDPRVVVRTLIMAKHAGIELTCEEVEGAYLLGADLNKVAMSLVRAKREDTRR